MRLQNQLEGFLEEVRIKLSSHVSDLLGLSSRRMLQALAEGETDAAKIAALAVNGLKATEEELRDALSAAATPGPLQRQILKLFLERLALLEKQIETLDQSVAEALQKHQDAVRRLAEMPGLGAGSAQQIFRGEYGIHRTGTETFQIEGDELESESFENAGELSSHGGIERAGKFLARDFNADDVAVMAHAKLVEAQGAQDVLSIVDIHRTEDIEKLAKRIRGRIKR